MLLDSCQPASLLAAYVRHDQLAFDVQTLSVLAQSLRA